MEQQPPSTDENRFLYPANFDRLCKLFGLYCDRVMHEDNLLNHRSSWHLSIQGFLFAGLGVLLKTDGKDSATLLSQAFPYVIATVGILVSLFAWLSLDAAHRAIERLDGDWHALRMKCDFGNLMPNLAGAGKESIKFFGELHGLCIPLTTAFA